MKYLKDLTDKEILDLATDMWGVCENKFIRNHLTCGGSRHTELNYKWDLEFVVMYNGRKHRDYWVITSNMKYKSGNYGYYLIVLDSDTETVDSIYNAIKKGRIYEERMD